MTKNKSRHAVLFALGVLWLGLLQAQESANSSGGNATGVGGTVDYSLGQVVYTTNTSALGTVSQGVQQAYEIFSLGIKEVELNISLSVFPNPSGDNLNLQLSDCTNEKLSYQLYDMGGKLLSNGQVIAPLTQINTSSLSPTTYFIKVINQENRQVQSFKIIKK
jgi:hypothetical protein